jgi:hypothetical protein
MKKRKMDNTDRASKEPYDGNYVSLVITCRDESISIRTHTQAQIVL